MHDAAAYAQKLTFFQLGCDEIYSIAEVLLFFFLFIAAGPGNRRTELFPSPAWAG